MSFEQLVEAHHKLTYSSNVQMVAQQMQNPLRNAITIVPGKGEAMSASDLFGKTKAQKANDRNRRNPEDKQQRTRRWLIRPVELENGDYIDTVDKWDSAFDPTSNLMKGAIAAVERGVFDTITGCEEQSDGTFKVTGSGIYGLATSGKRPDTTTGLPAGNIIAAGTTGLTLDKLRAARKTLKKADFGIETMDDLWCLISPDQEDDLLGIAAASGPTLNTFSIDQLRTGKPTPLLGINWILSNRVPYDASGNRLCALWSKSNIVAGVWQDVQGRMWNDGSRQDLPYYYVSAAWDCVRIEDAGVRVISCKEA